MPDQHFGGDELLQLGEAGCEYGVPAQELRAASRDGELRAVIDGARTLLRRWEVAAYAARRKVSGGGTAT